MAASKGKARSALGTNPLSQGIFSKTEPTSTPEVQPTEIQDSRKQQTADAAQSSKQKGASRTKNQESVINTQESSFLDEQPTERVNLRLSVDINDWLDNLLKQGKRKHGRKIPKEIWVQAALEFFRALPVEWQDVESEESLRQVLLNLESRINKK